MLARQEQVQRLSGRIPLWVVACVGSLVIGYLLGLPRVKPYLLDILLCTLAACFTFIALAGAYIFIKPVKRSDTPQTVVSAVAVAVLLIALFFIGKWISVA